MQKMQQTLPIIPWMGGKRRLAKHLLPMFPEHSCYVELFSGGAALFFMRPTPAKVEVLNDINGQLVNLYRVVQHHFDKFIRQFEWILTSREVFARLQSTPPGYMTDIQRAARFFYLQHNAFGGKTVQQHFGTATTSKAWDTSQVKAKLTTAKIRLNGVFVEIEPLERCFKRYTSTPSSTPPSVLANRRLRPQLRLDTVRVTAKSMVESKGKVMLSINDHPGIRELFKDFRTTRLELAYSVSRDKTQKNSGELVICNW